MTIKDGVIHSRKDTMGGTLFSREPALSSRTCLITWRVGTAWTNFWMTSRVSAVSRQ